MLGCVGVDERDDIWILPDVVWSHMQTDRIVDELILQMRTHRPAAWWLENENIAKAFGPFLIKRMHEEKVYTLLDGNTPSKDKMTRARSIQGRIAMGKVHFPRFAAWWPQAQAEMLNFPNGAHDDFVDFLAHVGLGLLKTHRARPIANDDTPSDQVGSIQWILRNANARAQRDKLKTGSRGW